MLLLADGRFICDLNRALHSEENLFVEGDLSFSYKRGEGLGLFKLKERGFQGFGTRMLIGFRNPCAQTNGPLEELALQ